jgi:F-type H+-transporting ATPase subunit delta
MAENVTIARPYAEAVFSIAVEEKELDKWQILLQAMNEACKNDFLLIT